MIWSSLVLLCFLLSIFRPPARLGWCAVLFCMTAVIPQLLTPFVSVVDANFFYVSSLISVLVLLLINHLEPWRIYSVNLQVLLLFDVLLNMFGVIVCYYEIPEFLDFIDLSETFLFDLAGCIYYAIAAYFIYYGGRGGGNTIYTAITSRFSHNWLQNDTRWTPRQ